MTTLETLAVVFAVYGVVFLAHRATQLPTPIRERAIEEDDQASTDHVEAM